MLSEDWIFDDHIGMMQNYLDFRLRQDAHLSKFNLIGTLAITEAVQYTHSLMSSLQSHSTS